MLPQTIRLLARQSATATRLSPAFVLPSTVRPASLPSPLPPSSSSFQTHHAILTSPFSPLPILQISHRSYSQQLTSQASPLTPPSHLNDKERLGYDPDSGTGDASLRRIDLIMGALVGIGAVIAGWTYFRSSSVKKQKLALAGGGGGGKVNVSLDWV